MSEIVAIITEYNPFHNGHKYQIDKIKEEMPDATVIAIMSGNLVQRGEFAFVNKYARAEMAVACGVDAVFELPFPYCVSTAEIFASAGVELAYKLGATVLYFGIESDSLENIEKIAATVDSEQFEMQIKEICGKNSISYPVAREQALSNLGLTLSKQSNDILAIEYIRAIKNKSLNFKYRAIKRVGAGYKDLTVCDVMSASAIRENYYKNGTVMSVPNDSAQILEREIKSGKINDVEATNKFLLSSILLTSPGKLEEKFDTANGMGFYIHSCASKCKNPVNFTNELSSKSYTTARLKRAIIYSLFDVTEINKSPDFTLLLGANEKGKKIIKNCRKKEDLTVITKHSDSKKLSENNYEAFKKGLLADQIFNTLLKVPESVDEAFKKAPYIK